MKQKRVAINALSSRQGGGQTYLANILKYAQDFPELEFFIFAPPPFKDLYSHGVIQVIVCKFASVSLVHRFIWERWMLPRLLKKFQIDLIFCPGGIINFSPPEECQILVTFQNMLPFLRNSSHRYHFGYQRLRLWLLRDLLAKSMGAADFTIFISEFARDFMAKLVVGIKDRCAVIPHGLSDDFRTQDTNVPARLKGKQYFLYVSMFDVYKCQREVVRAYMKLRKMRKTSELLVLAGPTRIPSYAKQVKAEIEKANLGEFVLLLGEVPHQQLPSLYHNAKAIIFASLCENCPNILIESLAAGKPLFVSHRPPMPEFAKDSAVYFNPNNPDELAERICQVIDDSKKVNELGHAAYLNSKDYSWETTARKTFQTMSELIKC